MQAEITYTRDTGEKLVNETFGPNNIRRRTSGMEEQYRVEIANGREARDLALDANGFVLVEHRSAMKNFFDAEELKRVYYPEVAALIQLLCGAERVVVFDHAPRRGDRLQGLRLGQGWPRALHAAHFVRGPEHPAGRAAAAEHRGARDRVLPGGKIGTVPI